MSRVMKHQPAEEPVHISIVDLVGVPDAIGGPACTAIHDRIAEALRRGESVALSFAGVEILFPAFLHTAVGDLYGEFDEELIREKLRVEDATPRQLATLDSVIREAKDYFRDPEAYQALLREVINEWM